MVWLLKFHCLVIGFFVSMAMLAHSQGCETSQPIDIYLNALTMRSPSNEPGYSQCVVALGELEEGCGQGVATKEYRQQRNQLIQLIRKSPAGNQQMLKAELQELVRTHTLKMRSQCRDQFETAVSNCQKPFELYNEYLQDAQAQDCEPLVHGEIVYHMNWLRQRFDSVKSQLIEMFR